MQIHCKFDQLLDPRSLKPHPKNRNSHSKEQIERLAKLYEFHGIRHPIIVSNLSGHIVAGHGRREAAVRAKIKEFPVVFQDFTDEVAEYAFIQADNAIALWAELDLSGINSDIGDLGPDFDLDLLGIKNFTLDASDKLEHGCDEDEVPEAKPEPKVVRGEVYILGNHRLMCGDSTSITGIEKLMNGEKADMVFTDPPYGMFLDTDYSKMPSTKLEGNKKYSKVIGDSDDFSPDLIQTTLGVFSYCKEVFMFGADYFAELLPNKNDGSWIVWDKRVTENFDKMIGSAFELCWSKSKHKREIARFNNTLFSGESDARNKVHPTQKPIKLVEWFVVKWSNPKNKIVDLFGGSGTTLIACEKTDRQCFMMELDPIYCGVILDRWQKFTGKKAHREDGIAWDEIRGAE